MKKNRKLLLLLGATASLFLSPMGIQAQESDGIQEYIPSESLHMENIPAEVRSIVMNEKNQVDTGKEYLTDAQVESISDAQITKIYDELKSNDMFSQATVNLDELVAEKLLEAEETPQTFNNSYLPDGYNNLNDAEKRLVKLFPAEALTYYVKSKQALETSKSLYSNAHLVDGNGDAFRHAYWNAILVQGFGEISRFGTVEEKALHGVDRTSVWTTAHEADSSGLPKEMDMNNNRVGQYHAYLNYQASDEKLKNDLVRMVDQGQMARIVNGRLTATNSDK